MNWHLGLRRLSAVFWGVPALFFSGIFVYSAFDGGSDILWMLRTASLIIAGLYIAHRLTCWIIDGLFTQR